MSTNRPRHPEPSPLTLEQINAALRLHNRLIGWQRTDAALLQLAETNPRFDELTCLLKVVAVNALYGTQVHAVVRMANHAEDVLRKHDAASAGPELVHAIAGMPFRDSEKKRHFLSFAAKFCHFFIDTRRFPIYDEAARHMLLFHLGKDGYKSSKDEPYKAFRDAFARLRASLPLEGDRDLDRYLWIAGMYARWLRQRAKKKVLVNAELLNLFKAPGREATRDLDAMLPPDFERPFLRSAI